MSDQEDFTATQSEIAAVSSDEMVSPDMPVEVYAKEAESLLSWVQDDKDAFLHANFDWNVVETLGSRIGALRYADTVWNNLRLIQKDSLKMFNQNKEEAEELKTDILAAMDFAFYGNPELLRAISQIREGSSNADLVMDMTAIADLGERNRELLEKINFDCTKLAAAAELGNKLGELLGATTTEQMKYSEDRIVRDKAYTLLKASVDFIRRCGKYVCGRDRQRLKGYQSRYYRTLNRRKKSSKEETASATEAVVA